MKDVKNADLVPALLGLMARTWTLGRVLIEHTKAGITPADVDLTEREELVLRLVEMFPGMVTEKTLCRTFNLSFSQAGLLVRKLVTTRLLQKKQGRGKPLALTEEGIEKAREVEAKRGEAFDYVCKPLDREKQEQLFELMKAMFGASEAEVKKRLFGIMPLTKKQTP
jgi:DNA-binding MarR family transcriptional regulator